MAKSGFTPVIGLAVVVALALAAVFGAMSLTNPAWAQDDPPDAKVTIYTDLEHEYDAKPLFAKVTKTDDAVYTARQSGEVLDSIVFATSGSPTSVTDGVINLHHMGDLDAGVPYREVTVTFTLDPDSSDSTDETVDKTVLVRVMRSMDATPKMGDDLKVALYTGHMRAIELSDFFDEGVGGGALDTYAFTGSPSGVTVGTVDGSTLPLTGDSSPVTTAVNVTVTATLADGISTVQAVLSITVAASVDAEHADDMLRDVTYGVGDSVKPINLYTYFDDGLGTGEITEFSEVVEGDRGVVIVRIADDSMLTINPLSVGTVEVVVMASFGVPVDTLEQTFGITVLPVLPDLELPMGIPRFDADSTDPGKNTRYEIEFEIATQTNTLINDLVIELPDYGVPASISTSSVTITAGGYTFTPEDVSVDGEEIFISIGDVTEDTGGRTTGGVYLLGGENHSMKVVFRQSAGISNPTESGTFFVNINFGDNSWEYDEDDESRKTLEDFVPRVLKLDEDEGGLGDTITATGKGYKNGTTLTVYVDELERVMWNDPKDNLDRMVPLGTSKTVIDAYHMAYDAAKTAAAKRAVGNVPLVMTKEDGTALHSYRDADLNVFASVA